MARVDARAYQQVVRAILSPSLLLYHVCIYIYIYIYVYIARVDEHLAHAPAAALDDPRGHVRNSPPKTSTYCFN